MTPAERIALSEVRDGLRNGAYVHVVADNQIVTNGFSMGFACFTEQTANGGCGTTACIGGWMALSMGMSADQAAQYVHSHYDTDDEFHQLFWGNTGYDVTPDQAADAIDRFLTDRERNPWWQ